MLRIRKRLVVTPRIAVGLSAFFVGMVGSIGILNALNESSKPSSTDETSSEVRKPDSTKLQELKKPVENKESEQENASDSVVAPQSDATTTDPRSPYTTPYYPQSNTSPRTSGSGQQSTTTQPQQGTQQSQPAPAPATEPTPTPSPEAEQPPVDESPLIPIVPPEVDGALIDPTN